jgi:RNA recognition motif-containing protein
MKTKLFVGNLSARTTEEDLSNLFAQAGTVESIELITVQEKINPKRFAFIDMKNQREAETAIVLLDGSDLNRRAMRVKIARPREARPAGGGWYNDSPPTNKLPPRKPSPRKLA